MRLLAIALSQSPTGHAYRHARQMLAGKPRKPTPSMPAAFAMRAHDFPLIEDDGLRLFFLADAH